MAGKKERPAFEQVYEIVRKIPRGQVLTYGVISTQLQGRLSAQGVGWALNALPEPAPALKGKSLKRPQQAYDSATVPWHRVINSQGRISTSRKPELPSGQQQVMLEAEGILFDADGKIDLAEYLWKGKKSSKK